MKFPERCPRCAGMGEDPEKEGALCRSCGGAGQAMGDVPTGRPYTPTEEVLRRKLDDPEYAAAYMAERERLRSSSDVSDNEVPADTHSVGPFTAVQRKHGYDHEIWDVYGPDGNPVVMGTIYGNSKTTCQLIARLLNESTGSARTGSDGVQL